MKRNYRIKATQFDVIYPCVKDFLDFFQTAKK